MGILVVNADCFFVTSSNTGHKYGSHRGWRSEGSRKVRASCMVEWAERETAHRCAGERDRPHRRTSRGKVKR